MSTHHAMCVTFGAEAVWDAAAVPAAPLVPRARLFDRLSAASDDAVTVVVAPAGAGKTALLRDWLAHEGLVPRTAWVTVERGEREAQRFWLAVIDALAHVPACRRVVEPVGPTPTFRGDAVVERLLTDLAGLDAPVALVVDDLHELRSSDALAQLERLVARRPAGLRIVLASRTDLQLGLHRLRLDGELVELREADLRFTLAETLALLGDSGLSDDGVALLHDRTEGWAAGLRLAALSLAGGADPERLVHEFSGSTRVVGDYLLAEVLERQPEEARRLLLRTSILERVSGPLADALTGGTGSERILLALEDENAFVTAIDAERTWFRYHQLLADLLRLELRRSAPAEILTLHAAAAAWFEAHRLPVEAIRHAQAAEDWPWAARLLADDLIALVFDGRSATAQSLLASFPAHARATHPEVRAITALGEVAETLIRPAQAERSVARTLEEAEQHLAEAARETATLPAERGHRFERLVALTRISLARRRGDLERVLREFGQRPSPDAFDDELLAIALLDIGVAELWAAQMDDARRDLEDALGHAREAGRRWHEVACLGYLAVESVRRSFSASGEASRRAMDLAASYGWADDPVVALALVVHAESLAWRGQLAEAERLLDRAEPLLPEADPATAVLLRHTKGMLRAGQGRLEEALTELRAVEEMQGLLADGHLLLVPARSNRLRIQVRLGDLDGARAELTSFAGRPRSSTDRRAAAAAIALAEGRPEEVLELLDAAAGGTVRGLHPADEIQAVLATALARDRLGDRTGAQRAIERALDVAEEDGLVLPFLLVPARELLDRHRRDRTAHASLLATILDVMDGASAPPRTAATDAVLLGELSEAELRVLRYLPSQLSAPEIAAELYVSVNTVRTHVRHVYEKLGAHSRTDAVRRARELGLLAPSLSSTRTTRIT